MAAIPISSPSWLQPGNFGEPDAFSLPPAAGAAALIEAGDFLVFGNAGPPPGSNLSVLAPPILPNVKTITTGGTVAAGVYRVASTYVDAFGETLISAEAQITTTGATSQIIIDAPPVVPGAAGWFTYITLVNGASGAEQRQQAGGLPSPLGTGFTLSAPPVSNGAIPGSNTTGGPAPLIAAGAAANTALATLPVGSYFAKFTYVYPGGESAPGPESAAIVVTAPNNSIVFTAPAAQVGAIGWNAYVTLAGGASGTETRANSTLLVMGTNFTETAQQIPAGISAAAVNAATGIIGIAESDGLAQYGGYLGGSVKTSGAADAFLLGASTVGTPLQPSQEPNNVQGFYVHNGQRIEMSLPTTFVYPASPGMIGAFVGLGLDTASDFYIADPSQTNRILQIVDEANGPGKGTTGDTGKRVIVQVLPAALAL